MGVTHYSRILQSDRLTAVTASTVTLDNETHGDKVITLTRAAGIAVTLPAATGSGVKFKLILGASVTSNATTVKVVGNDIMQGLALIAQDGGDTSVMFETAADSDTISFNGSTTGGLIGADVELIDMAADTWHVIVRSAATGTEATPFSATVS
jgi:hypothetical protein